MDVFRLTTVFGRVRQRIDDIEKLDDAAWPTVGQNDRACMLVGRTNVQEVNAQTVNLGSELRIGIQTSLEAAPVIGGPPVRQKK
jgi:hypothetical protein